MTRKRAASPGRDERTRSAFSRRRALQFAGVGVAASLAGCSGGGTQDDEPDTNDADDSSGTDGSSNSSGTDEGGFDTDYLTESPSSHLAPTDGFADASWLAGTSPEVVKVTSLDASGEGSLRWALTRPGTSIVVFEVGGVVDLDGETISTAGDLYVAGQTAPSPGITVVRGGIHVNGDNVILQHLNVLPGDELSAPIDSVGNHGGSNVVVDHCTVGWGTDENLSTTAGADNPDITFTNNLVAECLRDSIHPKGAHSMGSLINDRSKRVVLAGNLWAHNVGRHPRLKGGTSSVVANNVMYNFDRGTNLGGGVSDETTASIVGNYYRAGEITSETDSVVGSTFTDASGGVRAYIAYNVTDPSTMQIVSSGAQLTRVQNRPLWPDDLTTTGAEDAYETVLAAVGARPSDRTPYSERILQDVRDRTGTPIDSQADVGGYPDFETTERALDVPDEGLAEWLHEFTVDVEG